MAETILQHWIFANFALPFFLVFFIFFAVLQKTKVLGGQKQLDALTAFVVGLIFVGFAYPKLVVTNMILFFVVAMIVLFVVLLLWGFVTGGEVKFESKGVLIPAGIVIIVSVIIALLWATGLEGGVIDLLFRQSWSEVFWTNFAFIVLIGLALALAWMGGKSGGD